MAGDLFVPLYVDYQSDPKILRAGPLAEVLFVRSLALCKRTMSDGHIDRAQLVTLTIGLPANGRRAVSALVSEGLWTETDAGWVITSWSKRNRAAADVKAQVQRRKASSVLANHRRWHVGPEGKPSDTCEICYPPTDPNRSPLPIRHGIPKAEAEAEAEVEAEAEAEAERRR